MNSNSMSTELEHCNRCCSDNVELAPNDAVKCNHCGFSESFEIWQLRGWRNLKKYPPTYGGIIFVYGKLIGRTVARWNTDTQSCDNPDATHWLRTPDPRKQIGM